MTNRQTDRQIILITFLFISQLTNPSHRFKFGTIADSSFTQMFADSNDPDWNRMNQFMKHYNFKDSSKAFQQLVDG